MPQVCLRISLVPAIPTRLLRKVGSRPDRQTDETGTRRPRSTGRPRPPRPFRAPLEHAPLSSRPAPRTVTRSSCRRCGVRDLPRATATSPPPPVRAPVATSHALAPARTDETPRRRPPPPRRGTGPTRPHRRPAPPRTHRRRGRGATRPSGHRRVCPPRPSPPASVPVCVGAGGRKPPSGSGSRGASFFFLFNHRPLPRRAARQRPRTSPTLPCSCWPLA